MDKNLLANLLLAIGIGQLTVLVASALVPVRLNWKEIFKSLPTLHRQMYWVYGGYTVYSIIALALITIFNAQELAEGSRLARCFCLYGALFWTARVSLQPVLEAKEYLTTWWLKLGYHALTVWFLSFTAVFWYAALGPRGD